MVILIKLIKLKTLHTTVLLNKLSMMNVPKTMRALRKETPEPGYKLVEDLPVPEPVDDEVLIINNDIGVMSRDQRR